MVLANKLHIYMYMYIYKKTGKNMHEYTLTNANRRKGS